MDFKKRLRGLTKEDLELQTNQWFKRYYYLFYDLNGETWKKGQVSEVALEIAQALENGNKVMSCGNGGSCSDSAHFTAEFNNQLSLGRTRPLPAIDLSSMNSTITAIANDWGYEHIFSKQVEGLGKKGDVLIAISTSGNSPNVLMAILAAKKMGIVTVLLTGWFKDKYVLHTGRGNGAEVVVKPDYLLTVDSEHTALVQGGHGMMLHTIVGLVDYVMVGVDYFNKETW